MQYTFKVLRITKYQIKMIPYIIISHYTFGHIRILNYSL